MNELSNKMEDILAENRQLRNYTNVASNFGETIEQIKLHDRDKIEDYKKLIQVLQEDNYMLEEERARLKNLLKQLRMSRTEFLERFNNLSKE